MAKVGKDGGKSRNILRPSSPQFQTREQPHQLGVQRQPRTSRRSQGTGMFRAPTACNKSPARPCPTRGSSHTGRSCCGIQTCCRKADRVRGIPARVRPVHRSSCACPRASSPARRFTLPDRITPSPPLRGSGSPPALSASQAAAAPARRATQLLFPSTCPVRVRCASTGTNASTGLIASRRANSARHQ